MLDNPKLKNMAMQIDQEIKFYNRNKKAYQMSEPSEELTIKPKGQKLEENIVGLAMRERELNSALTDVLIKLGG